VVYLDVEVVPRSSSAWFNMKFLDVGNTFIPEIPIDLVQSI
jgi:hypothetical protein